MATNVSTIGSGQDYTTVTAWEAAVQGDLVSAGNIEKGEMIDQAFDERVTIDGSTTDASNYLWLTVKAGNEHDGTAGGGPRIVPSSGTGHILTISDPYTRIEGIELDLSNTTGNSDECIRLNQDNILIRNCLLHTGTARTNQDGIYIGPDNSWTFTVENCCIFGFGRVGIHLQNWSGSATVTGNIRNCTIYNCGHQAEGANSAPGGIGAHEDSASGATTNVNVDNTIALNNTTGTGCEDFNTYAATTPNWSGDGNISSDTSCTARFGAQTANLDSRTATANASPGAGDWVIFTNITGGSEDFHLQSSAENDAEGNGIDLSGNFTDDFDGDTRSDWDSGFDEIVAAPAGRTTRNTDAYPLGINHGTSFRMGGL